MGIFLFRCFFSFISFATPLLVAMLFHFFSFLKHYFIYNLLLPPPQEKLISRCRVNEFSFPAFLKYFVSHYYYICLSLSLYISLKSHSFSFVHKNANPVLYNSSSNSIVQLSLRYSSSAIRSIVFSDLL